MAAQPHLLLVSVRVALADAAAAKAFCEQATDPLYTTNR